MNTVYVQYRPINIKWLEPQELFKVISLDLFPLDGTRFPEAMSNLECLCSFVTKGLVLSPCCKLYLSLQLGVFLAGHQKWKHTESVKTVNSALKGILIEKILSLLTWGLLIQKGHEVKGFYKKGTRLVRIVTGGVNYGSFSGAHGLAWHRMGKTFLFSVSVTG